MCFLDWYGFYKEKQQNIEQNRKNHTHTTKHTKTKIINNIKIKLEKSEGLVLSNV